MIRRYGTAIARSDRSAYSSIVRRRASCAHDESLAASTTIAQSYHEGCLWRPRRSRHHVDRLLRARPCQTRSTGMNAGNFRRRIHRHSDTACPSGTARAARRRTRGAEQDVARRARDASGDTPTLHAVAIAMCPQRIFEPRDDHMVTPLQHLTPGTARPRTLPAVPRSIGMAWGSSPADGTCSRYLSANARSVPMHHTPSWAPTVARQDSEDVGVSPPTPQH